MTNFTKRKDPLGLLSTDAAKPVLAASTVKGRESVTSRVENMVVGQCPVCQKDMARSLAEDVPVYVCLTCCVCLPTED